MEHVNRFIIQCGEAANRDELRVRLFSSSLSGSAFTWFISLPPNSVITWANLEKQFHKYFFSRVHKKKITDLVRLKQHNDESMESFVQRLRDVKNKCYSLVLDDWQLVMRTSQPSMLPLIPRQPLHRLRQHQPKPLMEQLHVAEPKSYNKR